MPKVRAAAAASRLVMRLSFVADDAPFDKKDKKRDFWRVHATGQYGVDCNLGEAMAREALNYMRERNMPPLLGWIIRDMIKHGEFGGVEVGFLHGVAAAAMRGFIAND